MKRYLYYECPQCEGKWFELIDVQCSGAWREVCRYACMDCAYAAQTIGGRDLLQNQNFDPPYEALPKYGNIITAAGWVPHWREGNIEWSEDLPYESGANPAGRPEFKPLPKSLFPGRVLEGDYSQCWFTVWRPHIGGVCQYNIPVPQGRTLKLSFMAQAWCSDFEDPEGQSEGEMYARLLIKHGGGKRWDPGWLFYPQWTPVGIPWMSLEWEFVADQPLLSVGVESWGGKWPKKHNDFIVSHARLEVQGEPSPPSPGPTPPSSDEILAAKVWLVKKQLAIAEGVVADWNSVLQDLEQPRMASLRGLSGLSGGAREWVRGLVTALRGEKVAAVLLDRDD